jgi:hypothetical protein
VAADECRHFLLLEQRLEAEGSHYGAMPAHDGLWESALNSAGSLAARLAVEHCTHEARGLDVLPQTIHRFRSNGDAASADLLQVRQAAGGAPVRLQRGFQGWSLQLLLLNSSKLLLEHCLHANSPLAAAAAAAVVSAAHAFRRM